jgi:hypothetical protein
MNARRGNRQRMQQALRSTIARRSSAGEALRFLDAMPDRLQTMVAAAEKRS